MNRERRQRKLERDIKSLKTTRDQIFGETPVLNDAIETKRELLAEIYKEWEHYNTEK
jgi:hypothetical protein